MTPEPARTVSVPANVTVSVLTLLRWMSLLEMAIAAESDAGRNGMARELGNLRDAIARYLPEPLRPENCE